MSRRRLDARGRRRGALGAMSALLVATAMIGACGSQTTTSASPTVAASPTASSAATPSSSPQSTAGGPSASPLVPVDPALLDLLPDTLEGIAWQADPSVDAGIAADAAFARIAASFATATYVDPATGEFAYVSMVRPSGVLSDAAFRDFRDSFDESACAQAGGVSGHAEATIGGHPTFIGTCAGGVTTYHLRVRDGALIVSVSAVGERRLGEKLVAGLGT